MPGRDWKFRISDILEAAKNILEITRSLNYEGFCHDKKAMQAVLYNFAVIGEAARKMPEKVTARYPAVPWREMGDMRNIVIHEYFGINTEILWETVQNELPLLVTKVKDILADG